MRLYKGTYGKKFSIDWDTKVLVKDKWKTFEQLLGKK